MAITFSGCEKDDICTEETPLRLVLEFYDISNPGTKKNVANLKAIGENPVTGALLANGVVFNNNTDDSKYLSNDNTIKLPLNPGYDITRYHIILNSTDTANDNEDIFEFNYTRQELFVSRACGYKTVFTLNDIDGLVHTDATTPDGKWMQNPTIIKQTITSENETHIKVYF